MRGFPSTAARAAGALALVALALAACAGGEPAIPTSSRPAAGRATGPSLDQIPALPAPCTDADAIRRLLAAISVPADLGGAQRSFTVIDDLYCVRHASEEGRVQMFGFVDTLVTRLAAGRLQPTPRNAGGPVPPTTVAAVSALVGRLFAYVGLASDLNLPGDAFARAVWDGGVKVALPGRPDTIVATSKDFATTWPGNFFRRRALVVVARQPDATPFQTGVPEYPPRYRVYVSPKAAMTNYGVVALPAGAPLARVEACPGDLPNGAEHPETRLLRILRVRDSLDAAAPPSGILPTAPVSLVSCRPYADAPPGGFGLLGTRRGALLALAGRAGAAVGDVFAARTAYAFDGGAGGKTAAYSGFVPVRNSRSRITGIQLRVDSATVTPTSADPFTAPVGVAFRLTAVPYVGSATTPAGGTLCEFTATTAAGRPVAVGFARAGTDPNVVTFTPARALSGGRYAVRASCADLVEQRGMIVP